MAAGDTARALGCRELRALVDPSSLGALGHPSAGGGRVITLALGSGYAARHGASSVRLLQRRLASVGDAPGLIDGRYGPLTERAVARFQAAHGLRVDGIAGPITLAALRAPGPVLALAGLGFGPGPIDGRYGPLTAHAVERFQRDRGLVIDGVAGMRIWRALRAAGAAERPEHRPIPTGGSGPNARRVWPTRPVPRARSAPRMHLTPTAGEHQPVPGLPVTLVLLALAALGLATTALSYAQTRARSRHAPTGRRSAAVPARPPGPPPDHRSRPDRVSLRARRASDDRGD